MKFPLFFLIIFFSTFTFADIIKPNPIITPDEVVSIQLTALQKNNFPYDNAGIEQTWEFAHPSNRMMTGPLENFTSMMYSSYFEIIEHLDHEILLIKSNESISFYQINIISKKSNKLSFYWIVEKVLDQGNYKNCWMTISVSKPIKISLET